MPQVIIRIDLPENAEVSVEVPEDATRRESSEAETSTIEEYWNFCTENTRRVYSAMARREVESGPFTLDEIADLLDVPRENVWAWIRNAGRGRNKWERDTGSPAPFDLVDRGPVANRQIRRFSFPEGIAEIIVSLD